MSSATDSYMAALDRLKKNKPVNVPKGSGINKDTVALEAGRKRGSIRNRPGTERLLKAIEDAQKAKTKRSSTSIDDRIERMQAEIEALKTENNLFKSRYLSLLFTNYSMAKRLKESGINHASMGEVVDIQELDDTVLAEL